MTFVHPWVLLLLAVPVLLGFWVTQRRAFGLVLPFDNARHRRRPFLGAALMTFELVAPLLLAVTLVILARPQVMRVPKEERVLTNIQVCLDVSGSMGIESRYGNARRAIEQFTRARDGDAFGLTIFGSEQVRWMPLTTDLQAVRNALPFANPRNQPGHMGGTSIGAAIRFCAANMVAETTIGDKLMIVVSDGVSFDLQTTETAAQLKDDGIVLYYVHVGTGQNTPVLTDIAEQTGGEAFIAEDRDSVQRVFAHIDRMEPARFAPAAAIPMDEFVPFSVAGLIALGLWLLNRFGMRYTPW